MHGRRRRLQSWGLRARWISSTSANWTVRRIRKSARNCDRKKSKNSATASLALTSRPTAGLLTLLFSPVRRGRNSFRRWRCWRISGTRIRRRSMGTYRYRTCSAERNLVQRRGLSRDPVCWLFSVLLALPLPRDIGHITQPSRPKAQSSRTKPHHSWGIWRSGRWTSAQFVCRDEFTPLGSLGLVPGTVEMGREFPDEDEVTKHAGRAKYCRPWLRPESGLLDAAPRPRPWRRKAEWPKHTSGAPPSWDLPKIASMQEMLAE